MYRYFPTGFCHLLAVSIELPPPKVVLYQLPYGEK